MTARGEILVRVGDGEAHRVGEFEVDGAEELTEVFRALADTYEEMTGDPE